MPKQRFFLSELEPGETGKIIQVLGGLKFISYLQSIGLHIGTKITKTHQTPQSGIITIEYLGRKFQLEPEVSHNIIVELEEEEKLPPFTIKI